MCPERLESRLRGIVAERRLRTTVRCELRRRFHRVHLVQVFVEAGKDLCHTERRAVFRKMRRKVWHTSCTRLAVCPAYILVVGKLAAETRSVAHDGAEHRGLLEHAVHVDIICFAQAARVTHDLAITVDHQCRRAVGAWNAQRELKGLSRAGEFEPNHAKLCHRW